MRASLRHRLGVLLYDWRPFTRALRGSNRAWLFLCNRNERLTPAPGGEGVRCEWRWSSELHAARVFPSLGLALMKRVLEDYPMASSDGPGPQLASDPAVSFVITHRGQERLPLLLATVNSIAAQSEGVECVVVEQSVVPECSEHLPSWVRYVHAPPDDPAAPFGKSKAYNVGVAHARAPVLVLHDGDVLVPMHYAREVRAKVADGFEAVDLKRYVFYLSEAHTARLLRGESTALDEPPEKVVQNLGAATTIAVTRAAFEAIGGFDEEFLGWGGEDLEFWERARTRKPYDYTYLPFIHLWHAPQPEKNPDKKTPGMRLYSRLSALPIEERIRALKQRGRI